MLRPGALFWRGGSRIFCHILIDAPHSLMHGLEGTDRGDYLRQRQAAPSPTQSWEQGPVWWNESCPEAQGTDLSKGPSGTWVFLAFPWNKNEYNDKEAESLVGCLWFEHFYERITEFTTESSWCSRKNTTFHRKDLGLNPIFPTN